MDNRGPLKPAELERLLRELDDEIGSWFDEHAKAARYRWAYNNLGNFTRGQRGEGTDARAMHGQGAILANVCKLARTALYSLQMARLALDVTEERKGDEPGVTLSRDGAVSAREMERLRDLQWRRRQRGEAYGA